MLNSGWFEHIPPEYQFFSIHFYRDSEKRMKISGWPLGTAPASCMVMKSCDLNRHQQTCPNMEWAKVSIQCGSSGKSIFSNIFYENMNIFKENHWLVKIMYFQVISCRKICILKGLPKVFIENIFLHITSRIHLLSVFISYHMVIWCGLGLSHLHTVQTVAFVSIAVI